MKNAALLSFFSSLLISAAPVWAASDTIISLPKLGSSNMMAAWDISPDGRVVIGRARNASNYNEAFIWQNGVITGLGFLGTGFSSYAVDMTPDHSVIVGTSLNSNGNNEAFRWQNGVMTGLGFLSGGNISGASAVNADGTVIVGSSRNNAAYNEAFRWVNGTMTGLGFLGTGLTSTANDVSANGLIVVGSSQNSNGETEAFRWENGTMTGLGFLNNTFKYSTAEGISRNGSVIIGTSKDTNGKDEAFRWENGTMTGLGFLGGTTSTARNMSSDGSIIVGKSENASLATEAFIWTQATGMKSLSAVLTAAGVDMTGWVLSEAIDVSDNGRTIVGNGLYNGQVQVFLTNPVTGGLTTPVDMGNSLNTVTQASRQASTGGIQQTSQGIFAAQNLSSISAPIPTGPQEIKSVEDIAPAAGGDFETVFSAFILGSYGVGQNNDFNNDQWNGTIGISAEVIPNLNIGFGIISQSSHEELDFKGESDMSAYGGVGLLAYEPGEEGLRIYATAFAADLSLEVTRGYTNGAGLDSSSGETDGVSYGGALKLGWEEEVIYGLTAMPYIEGRYSKTKLDGYAEEGGAFDASFSKQESNCVSSRIGVEFDYKARDNLNLILRPAWGHRWSGDGNSFTANVGGLSQGLSSSAGDKNWAEMTIGAKYQATDKVKFTTELTGRSGDTGEPAATIMIGSSVRF